MSQLTAARYYPQSANEFTFHHDIINWAIANFGFPVSWPSAF
jgi:hypothetical protein